MSAVSVCLEAICPDTKFPNKLPASMSMRLKLATQLADHIKQLGYRSDMGYQTILYCNEVEVRRVLMFLVERLPREASKTAITEELGKINSLTITLSYYQPSSEVYLLCFQSYCVLH